MPNNYYTASYIGVIAYAAALIVFGFAVEFFARRLDPQRKKYLRVFGIGLALVAAAGIVVIILGEPALKYYHP